MTKHPLYKHLFRCILVITIIACTTISTFAQTALTTNGKALMLITISPTADAQTQKSAASLADYLHRISGAAFAIKQGNTPLGITVGTATEFPAFAKQFDFTNPDNSENYLIQSHADGVYLIGASPLAVNHAVWDFLYRLGYRDFFPSKHWEIIPRNANLAVDINVKEHPDFLFRRIFCGSGSWPGNMERWQEWNEKNRMEGGIVVNTTHAWNIIYTEYKSEFDKHPEYFALVNGKRQVNASQKKFCLSNAGVRQIFVQYALDYFQKNPNEQTISIEPSDGHGWCQCDQCKAMGSPSDQMVILANQVIDAVRAKYPGKYVAFYAYNDHSPPPTLRLHPGVIVSVATAFVRGGYTVDELVKGWRAKGAEIGIRDYMSVMIWDYDLPNMAKSSQLNGLATSLNHYHQMGARFYIAEASDSWGPHGLGYYLASRMLWDNDATNHVDQLFDDFISKSFSDAQQPMRQFYQRLTGIDNTPVPSFNRRYIGQLYLLLNQAWQMSKEPQVHARLGDLAQYLHHLELYDTYVTAQNSTQRQQDFEAIMRQAYRIRDTQMIHGSYYYRKGFHNNLVKIPANVGRDIPADKDPWKSAAPYSEQDIEQIIKDGVTNNMVSPEKWQVQLAAPPANAAAENSLQLRGKQKVLLYALQDGDVTINPDVATAGSLFFLTPTFIITDMDGHVIKHGFIQAKTPITFPAKAPQSYLLDISGGENRLSFVNAAAAYRSDIYHPTFPPGEDCLYLYKRSGTFYVYVPSSANTWSLALTTQTPGETAKVTVTDPQGTVQGTMETSKEQDAQLTLTGSPGFWKVQVNKADTGALYKVMLKIDKQLSPWVISDPQHPLIISAVK